MNYFPHMPVIPPPPRPTIVDGMPADSIIVDDRPAVAFGTMTFAGYQKAKVKTELFNALVTGSVDLAQYWCADLVCSGGLIDVRDIIVRAVSKHTVLTNPGLTVYVSRRMEELGRYVSAAEMKLGPKSMATIEDEEDEEEGKRGKKGGGGSNNSFSATDYIPVAVRHDIASRAVKLRHLMMELRNRKKVRELVAEILFVVWASPKTPGITPLVFEPMDEFVHGKMAQRLRAPDTGFGAMVRMEKDADEMRIAANEFAFQMWTAGENRTKPLGEVIGDRYHVQGADVQGEKQGTTMAAAYWIEWTIEFDRSCRARKSPCVCDRRLKYAVADKHKSDPIWILWDILILCAQNFGARISPLIPVVVDSLSKLYCAQYSSANAKKNRHLLYAAVRLITETADLECPLLSCAVPADVRASMKTDLGPSRTGTGPITGVEYGNFLCTNAKEGVHGVYAMIQG